MMDMLRLEASAKRPASCFLHSCIRAAAVRHSDTRGICVTAAMDPQKLLNDLARLADNLRAAVSALPIATLDGAERKEHILDACNSVAQPAPAQLKLPIPPNILEPSYLPRTCIGLIGSTGLGKSTLLSGVLGRNISSADSVKRGTAVPTIVIYHPHERIEASLTFMPLKEVQKKIESTFELLEPDESGRLMSNDDLNQDPSYKLVIEAFGLTKRDLMGIKRRPGEAAEVEPKSPLEIVLQLHPELVGLLGTTVNVTGENEADFLAALAPYMGSPGRHKGLKKWAFLTSLVVKCNAEAVSGGSILVDFPGSGDSSSIVLRAIEKVEQCLDVRLLAVMPQRASTEAVVKEHMDNEIRRRRENHVAELPGEEHREKPTPASSSGLAIILTQCDILTRSKDDHKLIQDLENHEDISEVLTQDADYNTNLELLKDVELKHSERVQYVEGLRNEQSGSNQAFKRPRASGFRYDNMLNEHDSDEDRDDDHDPKIREAVREEKQWRKRCDQHRAQRRISVLRARYLVSGASVRRRFGDLVLQERQDRDQFDALGEDAVDDEEDFSLPVFATSAADFEQAHPSGDKALEQQTGVPALRAFIRHAGARAQYRAVLDLLQPFRAEVQSTHLLLTANDSETTGDRLARQKERLRERWATPTEDAPAGPSSRLPGSLRGKGDSIRNSLVKAFEKSTEAELENARDELEKLRDTCEKGARNARKAARKMVEALVNVKMHYAKHRAVFRHHGIYEEIEDYNVALAQPLIDAVNEAVGGYSGSGSLGALRASLIQDGANVFDEVLKSAKNCDEGLRGELHARISQSRGHLKRELEQLNRKGNSIFWNTHDRSSVAHFRDEMVDRLEKDYDISAGPRFIGTGRGSPARMKAFFVDAVDSLSKTMFDELARDLVEYQYEVLDEVGALIKETYSRAAAQCEMEISNAWVVPERQPVMSAREQAARAVADIERQLSTMERELIEEMRRAEENVPTCHPPPFDRVAQ
ncbi:unnamed protein product [Peniophora sp. CBMAI 1063]|nr:unnamed protein product [Peniophora sp. CBMAI 1063]